MKKIAITGSTGLIGSRIIELLKNEFRFIEILQSDIDITNRDQTAAFIKKIEFDLLLHLAGYTDVDGAENKREITQKINVDGTKNVFDAVFKKNKQLIYISTDFVFDGQKPPYFEDSVPHPLSFYAQTKYEGEKIVGQKAMIVRLSYPYRKSFTPKRDFVRNIKLALEKQKPIQMVTDSLITPTFIDDIAFGLKHLINNYSPEIYHLVGGTNLSPYEAGRLIAKTFNLDDSLIRPTTYREYYENKAPRPQLSDIRSKKNHFLPMNGFQEGLKKLL